MLPAAQRDSPPHQSGIEQGHRAPGLISTRKDNSMTEAEATVRLAIVNAITATSDFTGLRAGPAVDRLVDAILGGFLD